MPVIDGAAQPAFPVRQREFRAPTFIPAWPVLRPSTFLRRARAWDLPYPLNAARATPFYVARNAIYHLFRALRLKQNEAVLVPDYHSGNEVSALRAAGASILFYSIGRNLQPDFDQLDRMSRSGARVLYVIHFIGWPQPMEELTDLCARRRLVMFEDCALSLLSDFRNKPLGSFADYSVFCLYKTLPVPNGGLLVQNENQIDELQRMHLGGCGTLSVAGRTLELALNGLRTRSETLGRPLANLKSAIGRSLTSLRLDRTPVGDIGFRLDDVNLGMSRTSRALIPRFDYAEIKRRRRENYEQLLRRLEGRAAPLLALEEGVCPLFFPMLVGHKESAARALLRRGIEATELWNTGDPHVPIQSSTQARYLRDHVLELPIHQGVSPAQIDYMADQVISLGLRV
jgi:dTDP-4-amino-4,6-dideoxygalactose transaminase